MNMEKQQRTCLICGITDRRTFIFPQGTSEGDRLRYDVWLQFCKKFNPPEERLNMKCKRLCILHFEDKYISDPFRKNKVRNAIPTLSGGSTETNRKNPTHLHNTHSIPSSHNSLQNYLLAPLKLTSLKSRAKQYQKVKRLQLSETCQNIKAAFSNQDKENVGEAGSSSNNLSDSISEADYSMTSESQPLLKERPCSTNRINAAHFIEGFGQHNFKNPALIKSLLDKVHMKKKGSVYVLPLKKKCNIRKLTKDRIERIIESLPTMDHKLKNRLLNTFRSKKVSFQYFGAQKKGTAQNAGQRKSKCSSCPLHCNPKPPPRVSHGLHVKVDGYDEFDEKRFENAENIFTVSTFLSNVNDKVQIERLCQLVMESVFRLKNVNVGGTMSKIEIYLCQDAIVSSTSGGKWDATEVQEHQVVGATCISPINLHNNFQIHDNFSKDESCSQSLHFARDAQKSSVLSSFSNKSMTPSHSSSSREITEETFNKNEKISKKQTVKIDLNFFHDHSYLSLDSQVLFEKPPYIIKLIDIDTFRSSSKKTRIIKCPPVQSNKKMQRELKKMQNQVGRLKGILKKRKENMDKIKVKLKYLGNVVCEEKGLKRIRYPRFKKQTDSKHLLENESTLSINEKKENFPKNKRNKKFILTQDFELSSFGNGSTDQSVFETSEVSFDNKLEYFYETYLEDCIEKG